MRNFKKAISGGDADENEGKNTEKELPKDNASKQ
jgi:hypothetical protein